MSQYTAELHVQHCSVLHPLMFDVQVQWCMLYQYGEHWLPLILGVSCKLGGPPPNMRGRF